MTQVPKSPLLGPFGFPARVGGGAAWTPADITNVFEWWRADLELTHVSNAVESWIGQINDNDAAQTSASLKPTFNSSDSDFNSQDSISFDSSTGEELLAPFHASLSQPFTFLVVAKRNGTGGGGFGRLYNKEAASTPMFNNNSSTNIGASAGSQITYNPGSPPNSALAYSHLYDNTNGELWENGASQVTGTIGTGTYTTAGINIGGAATSRTWDGKIAELVVVAGSISNSDHNEWGTYVEDRYNFTWTTVT